MNPEPQKPTLVQLVAVAGCAIIAVILSFGLMWCAIWKMYIDAPLLMSMSTILGSIGGALTTILIGRNTFSQNQNGNPQVNAPAPKP